MSGPPYLISIRAQRLPVGEPLPEKSHVKLRIHGLLDGTRLRKAPGQGERELVHDLVILDVDEIRVSTPPTPEPSDQAEPAPLPTRGEPCLAVGCDRYQSETAALCDRCYSRAQPHVKRAALALRRAAPGTKSLRYRGSKTQDVVGED